jgi:hypothetical protein
MSVSSTRNVKLGVCRVIYDGVDLGLTQGGVEVSVQSESHKVEVDQFGKTVINEYVMGRSAMVKVPLAETTMENMVKIMPGAELTEVGGAQATGTITFADEALANDIITINGVVFTCKASPSGDYEFAPGLDATASAANLVAKLNASSNLAVEAATYSPVAGVITVTYGDKGVVGNTFTLGENSSVVSVSGATLTGGVDPTTKFVEVSHGVGLDLLASAKELRLHPTAKADADKTDDFVFPLANTPGALQFAYKLDQERIFNVEFTGYPHPTTGKLFYIGNKP